MPKCYKVNLGSKAIPLENQLALAIAQCHEGAWRCGLAESPARRQPYGQFQSRISLERLIAQTSDLYHSTQHLKLYKP